MSFDELSRHECDEYSTFLNLPPPLLNSSTPQLRRSLIPPVNKIPPHLLPSSTPPLFGNPVDKIPPHLLNSSTPPLSGTPVDKIPPHLLNSTALWYPKWPPTCSLAAQVDKIPPPLLNFATLWYPQWTEYFLTSSTPPLSGAPSGALWHLSWQLPLLSSATSGNTNQMDHYLLLACTLIVNPPLVIAEL